MENKETLNLEERIIKRFTDEVNKKAEKIHSELYSAMVKLIDEDPYLSKLFDEGEEIKRQIFSLRTVKLLNLRDATLAISKGSNDFNISLTESTKRNLMMDFVNKTVEDYISGSK